MKRAIGRDRRRDGLPAGTWLALLLVISSASVLPASFAVEPSPSFRVEPDVEEVPANHLKFYLHFPEPMERGEVFRHLRLVEVDSQGREIGEVAEPFREVELWDESFRRLTLWFHPGRQKPGVNLNVEIGPVLEEGKRYRIEVSEKWRTESGAPLSGQLSHQFSAGAFDDVQPDPDTWGIGAAVSPRGISTRIFTGETLDPESARARIRVFVDGEEVAFSVDANALVVQGMSPRDKEFRIRIDPRLEDLAGNSLARPFNLDLEANPDFVERTEPVEIVLPRKIRLDPDAAFPGEPSAPAERGKGTPEPDSPD